MRPRLVTLLLAGWAIACTPDRVPPPVAQTPPTNAARPAPAEIAAPERARDDSDYVQRLRAQLKAPGPWTLVPELQRLAERSLDATGHAGALVAIDPEDGKVLALYSVSGDRGDPLFTVHEPASTFKVFSAIAALEAGVIDAETTLSCTGSYPFRNLTLTCPMAHGVEDVSRAIAASCNAFFYATAEKQGPLPLLAVARNFGLGERTGIELDDPPGVLRNPVPDAARPALDLADAVGHGAYQTTPLGLARAYAAIANGGSLVSLHLSATANPAPKPLPYPTATLSLVRAALLDAVEKDYGRAHAQRIEGYPFAGKTGGVDAPPLEGEAEETMDSWFVAYAPPTHPKLLIAARMERVPMGGTGLTAAQVVREVLLDCAGKSSPNQNGTVAACRQP